MTPAFNRVRFDKRWGLLGVSILSGLLLWWKTSPVNMAPTVKTTISQQRNSITSIDQTRSIASTKVFFLDSVSFPENSTLVHGRLGPLGFTSDFFMDIECRFTNTQPLSVEWNIESDDGFRLSLDGALVSEFLGDRPYASSTRVVAVAPGTHTLRLSYFQGFGKLGLRGTYRVAENTPILIGQSGDGVIFEQFPPNPAK